MIRDWTPAIKAGQLDQWLAALDTYDVQFLVVDKQRDRVLLDLVRSQPGWGIDFEDGDAALVTRVLVPEPA